MQAEATTTKKKRGGNQPGAGRPLRNPELGRRKVVTISLRPDHVALTAANRSALIEKALDAYFKKSPAK